MSESRTQKLANEKLAKKEAKKQQSAQKDLQNGNAPVSVRMLNMRLAQSQQLLFQSLQNINQHLRTALRSIDTFEYVLKQRNLITDEEIKTAVGHFKKLDEEARIKQLEEQRKHQIDQIIKQREETEPKFKEATPEEKQKWGTEEFERLLKAQQEAQRIQMITRMVEDRKAKDPEFAKWTKETQYADAAAALDEQDKLQKQEQSKNEQQPAPPAPQVGS